MSAPVSAPIDVAQQLRVERFLYEEAALLDAYRLTEWLALVTDDVVYRMPVALPDEPPSSPSSEVERSLMHFEDDHGGLSVRVARLGSKAAWSEQPRPLLRRAITNVRVYPGEDGQLDVRSNFLLYQYQHAAPVDLLAGARNDVLCRSGEGFRIRRRTIELDQRVLVTRSIGVLF